MKNKFLAFYRTVIILFAILLGTDAASVIHAETWTITVNAMGDGEGTVFSTAGSIDFFYPGTSTLTSEDILNGTMVDVVATADPGSLASWDNCEAEGGMLQNNGTLAATCTFLPLDSSKTITATFTDNTSTITVNAMGDGSGMVGSTAGSINFIYPGTSTLTSEDILNGTMVDVVATADPGSLASWDNCEAEGGMLQNNGTLAATCTFLPLDSSKTITATFTDNTHTIMASAGPNGSISPAGAVKVDHSSSQSFTITPDADYHVADVLVDGVSVGAVDAYTFTEVMTDHTITASFAIDQYTLTVTLEGNGSGTVSSSPAGIDCGSTCSQTFDHDVPVTLTATPENGSRFAGWSGDPDCKDGEITVTGNVNCTATFSRFPWILFHRLIAGKQ